MEISRRQVLKLSTSAAVVFAASGYAGLAHASQEEAAALIAEFTGGKEPASGRITLTLPETAENGNSVALSVSVESAMEGDDLVESIIVVADGNPRPHVAKFNFTELSGVAAATTRIRMAQSQSITAIAKMRDGSLYADRREVHVLVGGCTG